MSSTSTGLVQSTPPPNSPCGEMLLQPQQWVGRQWEWFKGPPDTDSVCLRILLVAIRVAVLFPLIVITVITFALSLVGRVIKGCASREVLIDPNFSKGLNVHDQLIKAIREKKNEYIPILLKQGASPHWKKDIASYSPLWTAAVFDNPEAIPLMIRAGAFIDERDEQGRNILDVILIRPGEYDRVVSALITADVNVNSIGGSDLKVPLSSAISNGKKNELQALLQAPKLHNEIKSIALLLALKNAGEGWAVEPLIKAAANPNYKDSDGNTALHYCKDPAHAQLLLEAGAKVNEKNSKELTPLAYMAGQYINGLSTEKLFGWRAGSDNKGSHLKTYARDVFFKLLEYDDVDINCLVREDDDGKWRPLLIQVVRWGLHSLLDKMVEHNRLDLDARDEDGLTAIDHAIANGDGYAVIKLFLAGATFDARQVDQFHQFFNLLLPLKSIKDMATVHRFQKVMESSVVQADGESVTKITNPYFCEFNKHQIFGRQSFPLTRGRHLKMLGENFPQPPLWKGFKIVQKVAAEAIEMDQIKRERLMTMLLDQYQTTNFPKELVKIIVDYCHVQLRARDTTHDVTVEANGSLALM